MKYLDLTFQTPEENLACDEALLDFCEEKDSDEVLRFWESASHFVVLGYSNKAKLEANLPTCQKSGIPILRRPSGGGAVVQGPGSFNYSLILKINSNARSTISDTNRYVMDKNCEALTLALGKPVRVRGITDLAIEDLKFSGNSQRRKRNFLLFHGTILRDFDISIIEKTLRFPSKVPCYREGRSHKDFVVNIGLKPEEIKKVMKKIWRADEPLKIFPDEKIQQLVQEKYSREEWNLKY